LLLVAKMAQPAKEIDGEIEMVQEEREDDD
jgi:hypothetical protein